MALQPGTPLGPYEIVAPLGAGGMGEVYRARDTRLNREVAVKLLPAHLAANPESRARFEREARAVSSLNHPNICILHDVGRHGEIDYLVMELLEGQSLAERVEKGPLPMEEVLRYGIDIAAGLQAAHRRGIVHRDLKPGNIMLTRTGAKLLDFGLARSESLVQAPTNLTMSPTVTRPLTAEGTIVGTFQYMAPEQLEGREADARTDLFAFGAVLFEMATGRRAFDGRSQASLIGSIMSAPPPSLKGMTPVPSPGLERLVSACLAKDPDERCQSAHDALLQLRWIAEGETAAAAPPRAGDAGALRLWRALALGFGIAAVALLVALVVPPPGGAERAPAAITLQMLPPEGVAWRQWNSMALSPDGSTLVFYGLDAQGSDGFWLRPLSADVAQRLPGTEKGNASFPFWAPDGRRFGFFAEGKLKTLEIDGAAPVTLCEAPDGRGGTWGADGTIVFSPRPGAGLMRIQDSGGEPIPLMPPAEDEAGGHLWPSLLPDGKHFLYLSVGKEKSESWLAVGALTEAGGQAVRRLVTASSGAQYDPSGRILYQRDGGLLTQRFDPENLKVVGSPESLTPAVATNRDSSYAAFTLSGNGALIYRAGSDSSRMLGWFDRSGGASAVEGPLGQPGWPAISPDGTRVAISWSEAVDLESDLWVHDLRTKVNSRLTFASGEEGGAVWSADGSLLYFSGQRDGRWGIYVKPADGSREERLLAASDPATGAETFLGDVSRDGRFMIVEKVLDEKSDLWVFPLDGGQAFPLVETPENELFPKLSPDGRWVAYTSMASGRPEIIIRSLERGGGQWQISTAGGVQPRWRDDGKELFYIGLDRMLMAVPVAPTAAAPGAGVPRGLFRTPLPAALYEHRYDVSRDGQRFVVVAPTESTVSQPAVVLLNWRSILGEGAPR